MQEPKRMTNETASTAESQSAPPGKSRVTLYDYAYETFAIQYIASTLKQHGYPVEVFYDVSMDKDYLDEDLPLGSFFSLKPEQAARAILATAPDVVGFSIVTVFYKKLARIMALLKAAKPEIVIIAGGPHCNLAPEDVLTNRDVDFVFIGDADSSLPMFLEKLEQLGVEGVRRLSVDELPGVTNMSDGQVISRGLGKTMEDMDAVPFPEKDAYFRKNPALKKMYTITCSRGCAYRCTYCNSNNLRKMYHDNGSCYYRMRSVANVIAELKAAKEKYNPKYVMFLDSLFAGKKAWLHEFAPIYRKEIGLPFFCETNPNTHTIETIGLLADAGCYLLQFGFQSANEEVRRDILHRRESNKRIRELVTHAKKRGIFVCIDHIANLPGETRQHLDEAVALYRELRPNWVNLGFLQFYPKAEIIEIALARRVLATDSVQAINRGEYQHSFRLVSKSDLSDYYRTLPMRLFGAFKLPHWLGDKVIALMDNPVASRILSPLGSIFIYASRIFCAFTDRRDFLVRHHVLRNLYVLTILLREKFHYGR